MFAAVIVLAVLAQDKIQWLEDYEAGLKKAKEEKKLIVLHFWSPFCMFSKQMGSETFAKPDVVKESAAYVNVKLDYTKNDELWTGKFQGSGTPMTLFLTDAGTEVTRLVGFFEASDYVSALLQIRTAWAKLADVKAAAEKTPKDVVALTALADIYGELRRPDDALEAYKKIAAILDDRNPLGDDDRKLLATSHFRIAEAAARLNQFDVARASIAKYEKIDPENKVGLLDDLVPIRVTLLAQVDRNLEGAMELIDESLKKFPDTNVGDQLLFFKGMLYQIQRNGEAAKAAWEECGKKYPNTPMGKRCKEMAEHGH